MSDGALYEQFVQVAEQRSFTIAAARLNVAQPWLSARIRRLERQLGYALFTRTTRKVELTEQGEILLPKAKAIALALHEFRDAARALEGAAPALRLGAPAWAGQVGITRRLLSTFRTDAARFRLALDVGWTRGLLEKLDRGELDASFALGPQDYEGFERLELQETWLEIEMPADDPLAATSPTPADLAGRQIRVFTRNPNPILFDHLFGAIAAAGGRLAETDSFWSRDEPGAGDAAALVASCAVFWEHGPHAGRVRRAVRGVPPVAFSLVRRRHDLPALDALWAIAEALIAETAIDRARGPAG